MTASPGKANASISSSRARAGLARLPPNTHHIRRTSPYLLPSSHLIMAASKTSAAASTAKKTSPKTMNHPTFVDMITVSSSLPISERCKQTMREGQRNWTRRLGSTGRGFLTPASST